MQVKVKRRGSDVKFVAKVVAIGVECDLALLLVEDDAFWAGQSFVRFGVLPRLQDSVLVVGYPIGGDTVSVTSGVVSRIEVRARHTWRTHPPAPYDPGQRCTLPRQRTLPGCT